MEGRQLQASLLEFADHRIELVFEQYKVAIGYCSAARFYEPSPAYKRQCRFDREFFHVDDQVRSRERHLVHLSRELSFFSKGFGDSIGIQLLDVALGKYRGCQKDGAQ